MESGEVEAREYAFPLSFLKTGEASGAGCDTSRYNFIVADEVVPFFVLPHDFTEEYLS